MSIMASAGIMLIDGAENESHTNIPTTIIGHFASTVEFNTSTLKSCSLLPNASCCEFAGNSYCGLKYAWEPTYSKQSALIAGLIPTIFAWIFTIFGVYMIFRKGGMWKHFIYMKRKKEGGSQCKHSINVISCFVTIIFLPIAKLLWDALDVCLDCYLFYQLEVGPDLLDQVIFRNSYVNRAILAFGILGCLKIPMIMYTLAKTSFDKKEDWRGHEEDISLTSNSTPISKFQK